jgi:hypothetical protein
MRKVNQIIIHCADTMSGQDIGAKEITVWHTSPPPRGNGWKSIAYAYVIRRSGELELGRDMDGDGDVVEEVGAHAAGFNAHSIGICLVGGKGADGKPENNFTPEQFKILAWLVGELTSLYPKAEVLGHRDLPGVKKACPSFSARDWWKENNPGRVA